MPISKLKNWFLGKESASSSKHPVPGVDLKNIKPYGDHLGDGAVQLSFTLPAPLSAVAKEAARLYAEKMGLTRVILATAEAISAGFTFFVVYGHCKHSLDLTKIKLSQADFPKLSREEIEDLIRKKIGRKIVVVGATTGSDAHTVGIDAILNKKGFAGDYGLESYEGFQVVNLRAQVQNVELVKKVLAQKADAVLISKLVTQQDQHLKDLKEFLKLIKQEKTFSSHLLKIVGGPRITHTIATQLGFDAGFGTGTLPSEVASFIALELVKRLKK